MNIKIWLYPLMSVVLFFIMGFFIIKELVYFCFGVVGALCPFGILRCVVHIGRGNVHPVNGAFVILAEVILFIVYCLYVVAVFFALAFGGTAGLTASRYLFTYSTLPFKLLVIYFVIIMLRPLIKKLVHKVKDKN